MLSESADHAIDAVLAHEGGYSDDVRHPNGTTNRGEPAINSLLERK